MAGLMIAGDTSLFENVDDFHFRDELVRHMFVPIESGPGSMLYITGSCARSCLGSRPGLSGQSR